MNGEALGRVSPATVPGVPSFEACVNVLSWVEELPPDAIGALTFDDGVILVEQNRVRWAISGQMTRYLTDIICSLKDPPLHPAAVEELYRRCRRASIPVSAGLLDSGLLSEAELRFALCQHNREAIWRLSGSMAMPNHFAPLARGGEDPRFSFRAVELLASIGARARAGSACAAEQELSSTLVGDATGFAFSLDSADTPISLIAIDDKCDLSICQILQIGNWAKTFLELAARAEPGAVVLSATCGVATAVITWRSSDVAYVALCTTRAASALLIDRVSHRRRGGPGVVRAWSAVARERAS
jgi:hypothetical protein